MEKTGDQRNVSLNNDQMTDFLRIEIDRLNDTNTSQSKQIIHIEGEKSKLKAMYEQDSTNWKLEKSQFISKEKKLKENHEKMLKLQSINICTDVSRLDALNHQIKRYVEQLNKSKTKYDTDVDSFKSQLKEKDQEIAQILTNIEKERDTWKSKEANWIIEKDFLQKEIERQKEQLDNSKGERIEEKNTFNLHNSEIKKVMQEQLEFIKQLQVNHSDQISKISSNNDKHYHEMRSQYEDDRNLILTSRDVQTSRQKEKLEEEYIMLKNSFVVLETRLKKSQFLLKEKHNTIKLIKKENFELIEKNQKLKNEIKSFKYKIKERNEETQIENLLIAPTSDNSLQNELNNFEACDGDNISIEYIDNTSDSSERFSTRKNNERPMLVNPLQLHGSKPSMTRDLNDSIRSRSSRFNEFSEKEREFVQNITTTLSPRSRKNQSNDFDIHVCIESESTRPKTLIKSRNSITSGNIERHLNLNLCSSIKGRVSSNMKKSKVDYINHKKSNDFYLKIKDHKRSKSFNVATISNTLDKENDDGIDKNAQILSNKLKVLEERMNRIETQNHEVAQLNMNIIKTSEFDDLMLTTTHKGVHSTPILEQEQIDEHSDEKTKQYNMNNIESQVNSQLNKIELKTTSYKLQNEKQDRNKKKPPICNTSNIKKNQTYDNEKSLNLVNTRLSNISIARSIDLNDKGFINFYKENRNISSFNNINKSLRNDFYGGNSQVNPEDY